MSNFLDKLPKEVQKNMDERGGEIITLHMLIDEISRDLIWTYMPFVLSSKESELPQVLESNVEVVAEYFKIERSLAQHIVDSVQAHLSMLHFIIKNTGFEKWYDAECNAKMSRAERRKNKGKRKYVFCKRIVRLEPGSTESDFKKAIREDMKNTGFSDFEIERSFSDEKITGNLDGKKVDLKSMSSYNKDKKKK